MGAQRGGNGNRPGWQQYLLGFLAWNINTSFKYGKNMLKCLLVTPMRLHKKFEEVNFLTAKPRDLIHTVIFEYFIIKE